jgi:hypothetical protein
MPKKAQVIAIEEASGERFHDLESAQRAALPQIADNLQAVIQDLLKNKILIVVENKLIPNPKAEHER